MKLSDRVLHSFKFEGGSSGVKPSQNPIKVLSHIEMGAKDILVLKSIFKASSNLFKGMDFQEDVLPQEGDLVLVNASEKKALVKWKSMQARFPEIKALMVCNAEEQKLVQMQFPESTQNSFIIRPINARSLQKNINYLMGTGELLTMPMPGEEQGKERGEEMDDDIPILKSSKNVLKIMVVDDSAPARQYINVKIKQLIEAEAEIAFAENGEEAIKKCQQGDYDLVFLDVEMPGMNGFEVCQKLREQFPKIRIVMLTGKSLSVDYMTGRKAGCNHYLTKPPQDADVRTILTLSVLKKKTGI